MAWIARGQATEVTNFRRGPPPADGIGQPQAMEPRAPVGRIHDVWLVTAISHDTTLHVHAADC